MPIFNLYLPSDFTFFFLVTRGGKNKEAGEGAAHCGQLTLGAAFLEASGMV